MNSAMQAFLMAFMTTISNIRANTQTFLISVVTIAISNGILGLFLIVFFNLNSFLVNWNQQVQLIIYLNDDISPSEKGALEDLLRKSLNVQSTEVVSKERAWREFRLDQMKNLNLDLGFNPLPASYKIRFKFTENRSQLIREFADTIMNEPGVESVEYGEKWIERFEKFMVFCRIFLMGTGGLLCFGLILIISNTIRLSIYSRQEEIELMLLIGATPRFVKIPFLIEGMLQGLSGVVFSIGLMGIIFYYLKNEIQSPLESISRGIDLQFISQPFLIALVGMSVFVGLLASYISTHQYLQVLHKR